MKGARSHLQKFIEQKSLALSIIQVSSVPDEDNDGAYETLGTKSGTLDDFASNERGHMVSSHDNYFKFVTQWRYEYEDSLGVF